MSATRGGGAVGHVGGERVDRGGARDPRLARERDEPVLAAGDREHRTAGPRELARELGADPRGGAGDDGEAGRGGRDGHGPGSLTRGGAPRGLRSIDPPHPGGASAHTCVSASGILVRAARRAGTTAASAATAARKAAAAAHVRGP